MIIIVVCEAAVFFRMSASQGHIGFTTDDGFHSSLFGFSIKLDGAEHVAVVGHCHSRLAERFDLLHQGVDLIRAVQEAELGVEMEMNKG